MDCNCENDEVFIEFESCGGENEKRIVFGRENYKFAYYSKMPLIAMAINMTIATDKLILVIDYKDHIYGCCNQRANEWPFLLLIAMAILMAVVIIKQMSSHFQLLISSVGVRKK